VLNAANEQCVAAFLAGGLAFPGIVDTVSRVLDEHLAGGDGRPGGGYVDPAGNPVTLHDVLSAETWARARADEVTGRVALTGAEGR
jgi:1-deoxy-D-xylulose-5-phosphate reductoisomerase